MSLAAIRAALATSLESSGLGRVYDQETEQAAPPCFVIEYPAVTYDDTFDGTLTYVFPVTLLISRAGGITRAATDIDTYVQTDGASSVPAAVNNATQRVVSAQQFGSYTIGNDEYVGIKFEVQVLA